MTEFKDIDLTSRNKAELLERRIKMRARLRLYRERASMAEYRGQETVADVWRKRAHRILQLICKATAEICSRGGVGAEMEMAICSTVLAVWVSGLNRH